MCSVVGCDSFRRSAQRFKLPEDPEKRLEWVQFLFEVNGQQLKESCWTDITICSEHFTGDCFIYLASTGGTPRLKLGAVPSLCIKSEPDEAKWDPKESPRYEEPVGMLEVDCEQLKTCDSPTSYYEDEPASVAVPISPVPSDVSVTDHGQILQNIVNLDIIREKAALLQMKGRYVVNEKLLIQLFSTKCPLCRSKVKVEKVVRGMLLILIKQCLQCKYRKQWKSLTNATVSAAECLTEGTEVSPGEASEESDPMNETEESSDQGQGDVDSDEDWKPEDSFSTELLRGESEEDSEYYDDDEQNNIYHGFSSHSNQLCTDCGRFYSKRWPHTCEHKVKPYSCNICGKRCASEVALNSHSRVHDGSYEYSCKYCNITFKTKVDKITHQQIHVTEGKPYKCTDCSETFASNKERRIHLEEHRGPQDLKCHICGIEFNRVLSIRRHLIVHTGEKPYKCSVCQRGFNQASHLKSHMRLHTGERPFKCQYCDRRFNHNVSLKSHVQRYHTEDDKKKGMTNKTQRDAGNNQNKRGDDSELDKIDQDQDTEETVPRPKKNKRSTGRPIGRPKRNTNKVQGSVSGSKSGKSKLRESGTQCNDEESEDELTESDMEEVEDEGEKVTLKQSTSRRKSNNSDSDTDFDPTHSKKKRNSRQNGGESTQKRRGRPRKNQATEDT